jgi:F-type H+-transporting ATPase subunit b
LRKRSSTVAALLVTGLLAGPIPVALAGQPAAEPSHAQPAPAAPPVEAPAAGHAPAPAAAGDHAAPAQPAAGGDHAPAPGYQPAGGHESAEAHEESPWGLIARIFNFAVLVGLLFYFVRTPFAQHLASRKQQISSDLVSARDTTERARQHLTEIDRRLKELPAELEALKARGAEEIASEAARIRQQAETERQRLLEQTRRDVEIQVRVAKQALADHTADLAVRLAKERVAATITPDEQNRLVDRYLSNVKELHG